jgi:hypothetical protein
MTPDELIGEARNHTKDIPKLSGKSWATLEVLSKVRTVDAVAVYFESEQRPGKILVIFRARDRKIHTLHLDFSGPGGQMIWAWTRRGPA